MTAPFPNVVIRDVKKLRIPLLGRVGRPAHRKDLPYVVFDATGQPIDDYEAFLLDVYSRHPVPNTVRAYAYDLLLVERVWTVFGVDRNKVTRTDLGDLTRLLHVHPVAQRTRSAKSTRGRAGTTNNLTGKRYPKATYESSRLNHVNTVLHEYFAWRMELPDGPIANPVHRGTSRWTGASDKDTFQSPGPKSRGRLNNKRPTPREIPDAHLTLLFEGFTNKRDWLVVYLLLWSGPRSSEAINLRHCDLDPGGNVVWVVRKGAQGERTPLPCVPVWFDLLDDYLADLSDRGVHLADDETLWRTNVGEDRPVDYDTIRKAFDRVNERLGFNYTLHDLRHTAAHRMTADPNMTLRQVQEILGHSFVSSTMVYTEPGLTEVVGSLLRHHEGAERRREESRRAFQGEHLDYAPADLDDLFGWRS